MPRAKSPSTEASSPGLDTPTGAAPEPSSNDSESGESDQKPGAGKTESVPLGQNEEIYNRLNYIDEPGCARFQKEIEAIREARRDVKRAQKRKEKAEGRYHAVLSGLDVITRQADRIEDGIAYIQNAYKAQEISGRLSFLNGGAPAVRRPVRSD